MKMLMFPVAAGMAPAGAVDAHIAVHKRRIAAAAAVAGGTSAVSNM